MREPVCIWPAGAVLGEGVLWSSRENAVYWVDIKRPAVHRLSLADDSRASWRMPEMIGWIIERRDRPGFIAGLKSGFVELTLDPVAMRPIGSPEPHLADNRLNDAKADRHGRIWAGSMDDREADETGSLYRLTADLTWCLVDSGYHIANGPTFSPDHSVLYHTDSAKRVVYRFDVAADGALLGKSVFVRFDPAWGYPDGMTTDIEGGVWIAHWGGGRVSRFTPDGRLDRSIALPVSQVTNCCFAGAGLDRMFVTTAAFGRSEEPLAGGLFELDPGIQGLATHGFAG